MESPRLVGGQRLGVPALVVERLHQQPPGLFPFRVLRQEGVELSRGLGGSAGAQEQPASLLPGGQAQLLEADGNGAGEGPGGELGQSRPSPPGEGPAEGGGGGGGPPGPPGGRGAQWGPEGGGGGAAPARGGPVGPAPGGGARPGGGSRPR